MTPRSHASHATHITLEGIDSEETAGGGPETLPVDLQERSDLIIRRREFGEAIVKHMA